MNFVHLHLAINHSPIYATLFAVVLLLISMIVRNRGVATTALWFAVVAGLFGVAAYLTGDQAKDIIDKGPPIAGVEKMMIEPHDQAAGWFLISSCVSGGIALIVLFVGSKRGTRPRWMEIGVFVLLLWSLAVGIRVALLGGRIHHEEVRAVITR